MILLINLIIKIENKRKTFIIKALDYLKEKD